MTFAKGSWVISVSGVPGYKNKCLLVGDKVNLFKVASFTGDEEAEQFIHVLSKLLEVESGEL